MERIIADSLFSSFSTGPTHAVPSEAEINH